MELILSAVVLSGLSAGWFLYKRRRSDADRDTESFPIRVNGGGRFEHNAIGVSRYRSTLRMIFGRDRNSEEPKLVQALLVVENKNKDRPNVRVEIDGRAVGYLPGDVATEYRVGFLDAGYSADTSALCNVRIVAHKNHADGDLDFSVRLDLPRKYSGRH
ncbi:MAG: hypothetical protein ACT4PS_01615 [Betaproteobacteria bacterium]